MRRRFVVCFILLTLLTPFLFAQTQTQRWTGKVDVKALSTGGKTWVLGPQRTSASATLLNSAGATSFGTNINIANPADDAASGQSEVSIAAVEQLVLAAWTDSSGLVTQPSTSPSGSATGIGFSYDGGLTYQDLIGLPNDNIQQQWFGDPIVVAIDSSHFIVASLYWPNADMLIGETAMLSPCALPGAANFYIALSVATVSENEVSFTNPIPVASGGDMCSNPDDLAFLDRESMAFDPETRTLAIGYSRFFVGNAGQAGTGQIEVVRATVPEDPALLMPTDFTLPAVVWAEEPTVINTGVSVAVAKTGDIYVAWERNWLSNLVNGMPLVYVLAARVQPAEEVVLAGAEPPSTEPVVVTMGQTADPSGGVKSLDNAADIIGYHIAVGNDFPQIVVNNEADQLVVVWNDASRHPLGDIFMRPLNMNLSVAGSIQKVNDDDSGALHFMPAISVRADGGIATSWYDRRAGGTNSAATEYYGELRPDVGTNSPDFLVSTGATDWLTTASLVSPNFGDYTSNFTLGSTTHFIWTDGRLGVAQPFTDQKTLDPDFEADITPTTATIDWGKSATFDVTVHANELFKGDVAFTCGTLPDGIRCQFAPTTLTLVPGQQAATTLTLVTGATTQASTTPHSSGSMMFWTSFGAFGFILLGGVAQRRRVLVVAGAVILLLLLGLVGCGGSSSSSVTQTTHPSTTPQPTAVSVPINVMNVGGTISHTITLNVTVMK